MREPQLSPLMLGDDSLRLEFLLVFLKFASYPVSILFKTRLATTSCIFNGNRSDFASNRIFFGRNSNKMQ